MLEIYYLIIILLFIANDFDRSIMARFIFPLVAFTTSPVFFGINFFALGTIYGIADSSFVLIIQVLHRSNLFKPHI